VTRLYEVSLKEKSNPSRATHKEATITAAARVLATEFTPNPAALTRLSPKASRPYPLPYIYIYRGGLEALILVPWKS